MSRGRGGRGRGGRGRGGQGNKGRSSSRGRSSSKGKGKSSSKGKGKGKGKSSSSSRGRRGQGNRSGGFGRANSQSKSPSKSKSNKGASTGRKGGQGNRSTRPGRAKGYSVKSVAKSVGKALSKAGRIASGLRSGGLRAATSRAAKATKAAAANTKQKSKLKQQISNFQNRVKQMSTPEAKRERIRKRLREQHGLDYDRMNPSFSVDVNVDRAMRHYKVPKSIRNMVPGPIKNIKFKKQFYSPTKLGAADGWGRKTGRYNRGGGTSGRGHWSDLMSASNARTTDFIDSNNDGIDDRDQDLTANTVKDTSWLDDLYRSHYINRGSIGEAARDYWSKEEETKGRDAVIESIIGTSKAQGTYGGAKKRRRNAVLRTIGSAMHDRGY